jgi:hypothetical protein
MELSDMTRRLQRDGALRARHGFSGSGKGQEMP